MEDINRILLECRYILSLNKNYNDLANYFHISVDLVYDDLNTKLFNFDSQLYQRVHKVLKKVNNY